jgi:hypothetical protein
MLTNAGPTIVVGTRTRGTRVSSSPSKIPYGEFSSVRLQTGFRPRPSPARSGSSRHPALAYTRFKSRSRKRATSRSGTCVQAALSPSDRTLPSRGPWLASGFCCPAGSSLTMTSSETLGSSKPTYAFADGYSLSREVPQFTLPVCLLRAASRTPADRTTAFGCSFIVRFGLPHPWSGSASASPRAPVPAWPSNEAAKFALCYGPEESLALHRPGRLRSSFHLLSRLKKASNITTRANQPIPAAGLAPARHAALWAATKVEEENNSPCLVGPATGCAWCGHMTRSGSLLDLAGNDVFGTGRKGPETASFPSCDETERRKQCAEWRAQRFSRLACWLQHASR